MACSALSHVTFMTIMILTSSIFFCKTEKKDFFITFLDNIKIIDTDK